MMTVKRGVGKRGPGLTDTRRIEILLEEVEYCRKLIEDYSLLDYATAEEALSHIAKTVVRVRKTPMSQDRRKAISERNKAAWAKRKAATNDKLEQQSNDFQALAAYLITGGSKKPANKSTG